MQQWVSDRAAVPGAVQDHGEDELRHVVGVLIKCVHSHHGLLFASLQVSVVITLCKVEVSFTGSASDFEILFAVNFAHDILRHLLTHRN